MYTFFMTQFTWHPDKDTWLQQTRGISFAEVVAAIEAGGLLEVLTHHNPAQYPGQLLLVVAVRAYAYVVPCILQGETAELKTIYPSRKFTRRYQDRGQL
jgi:hypothetical protein